MTLKVKPKIDELFKRVEVELKKLVGEKFKKLILFGSYSRGDYDNESDIDIIALVDEPHPDETYEEKLLDIIVDISIEYEVLLSLILENEKEYENTGRTEPLLEKVKKEGIEIYAA